jgi:hypothetical protein
MAVEAAPFKFEMGDNVKDALTGFKGFINYRCQFITGCNQYGVQPKMKKSGEVPEYKAFDENRLVKEAGGVKLPEQKTAEERKKEPGGAAVKINQSNRIR